MENLTHIAKQRAERAKRFRYTTPLPFDGLANGHRPITTTLESTSTARSKAHQRHVQGQEHQSDNSSHSNQSQISSDPTSSSSGRTSNDTYRQTSPPKHVPLYTLIDFRVSHSRNPTSQAASRPSQGISDPNPMARDPNSNHQQQRRVPYNNTPRQQPPTSTVSVEAVEGVPLTATKNPHSNPDNKPTIPEVEAEVIQSISSPPTRPFDPQIPIAELNLYTEFEAYQRQHARPSVAIYHSNHYSHGKVTEGGGGRRKEDDVTAGWTKQGWESRMRKPSVSRGAGKEYVDGGEEVGVSWQQLKSEDAGFGWPLAVAHTGVGIGADIRARNLPYRPPSLRSEASAAPAPTVPMQRR